MTKDRIDPTQYGFPQGLSQPATRALLHAGYDTLEKVAPLSDKELLALHGMGPKGVRIVREALRDAGLSPDRGDPRPR